MKKNTSYGVLIFFLFAGMQLHASNASTPTLSEKEKLTRQILDATGMSTRIDLLTEQAAQNVKKKIRPGYVFNNCDISKDEFWQPLLSDYAARKESIRNSIEQDFFKYFEKKYSEEDMRQILAMVTSEGWKKMMQNMMDPENPANTFEKNLRSKVYELIKEKTQSLKKLKN